MVHLDRCVSGDVSPPVRKWRSMWVVATVVLVSCRDRELTAHRLPTPADIVSTRAAQAALAEARRASRAAGAEGRGERVSAKYEQIFPEDVLVSLLLANACLETGGGRGERISPPTHLTGVRPLEHVHPAGASLWGWFHHGFPGRLWRGQLGPSWPTFAVHKVVL